MTLFSESVYISAVFMSADNKHETNMILHVKQQILTP
jgi:hypothetical protein